MNKSAHVFLLFLSSIAFSTATFAGCKIGDTGPAGGVIFYCADNTHGLEAAPVDQTPSTWGCWGWDASQINTAPNYGFTWTTVGSTGTAIGTGAANTAAIIAACGTGGGAGNGNPYSEGTATNAAATASAYTLNGYSDWYLPSRDELSQLYLNLEGVVGGFAYYGYWSSSENDNTYAWYEGFGNGDQHNYTKDSTLGVRAIRSFSLSVVVSSPSTKNLGIPNGSCPSACDGNPINSATGNKFQTETDFVGAANTEIQLQRIYNSQDTTATAFGANWHSTWHRSISLTNSTTATVTSADGRVDTFTKNTSGVWASDPDVTSTLTAVMSGSTQTGWKLVSADDSTETYTADGRLSSVTDRAGNVTNLNYDANKRLITVIGHFGHTLSFAYNTNNLVASVTLPDSGVLSYGYDTNNNLTSVTYPDKAVRQYIYNEQVNTSSTNLIHALTGITDEDGNRYATYQYDVSGRAITSTHAGGADKVSIAYNADGTTSVTDANGNVHGYNLTTQFGLVKPTGVTGAPVTNAGGQAFTYDANGFVASLTDWNGNITTYTHNTRGLETSRTEASGTPQARTITTTWLSTFHLPTQITEPSGVAGVNRVTTLSYDASGNLLTKTIAAGSQISSWTYTYNSAGQVLTTHDPLGNVTTYSYDTKGDVANVTDALSHVTQITSYDADGRPLTIKDANGLVTTLGYDARGRLISRAAGSETTTYAHDAAGNLTQITKPDGSIIAYAYDAAHRLTTITDALGNQIIYTLDGNGNRTAVNTYDPTNKLTRTLAQQFDTVSRLAKSIGAQGQTTVFAYDNNGNPTGVTDPLNNTTSLAYDPLNRLISSIDPNGNTTQSSYDSADNLLAVADPLSYATDYSYDGLGNRLTTTSPDTKNSQNSYDAIGNLLSSIDALGQTVSYSYDAMNRRTQTLYANKPPIKFTYDQGTNGIGHLTQMSDGTDTTGWAYDQHGRVTSKTFISGSLTLITRYAYNANGQLASITYPSGKMVKLSYNSNGQITELDNNGSPLLSSIQYQPFGLAKSWKFGNGITTSRSFDLDGHITGYDLGNRSRQLAYDFAGRITSYTDSNLSYDQSFTYDNLSRLTQYSDPSTQISYSYDANGNRTQLQTTGSASQNYTLDANSNRLLGITSNNQPVKTYSYDADGHITSDGYTTFSYDGRGRLVQASNVALGTEQYRINGLGQRDAKVTGKAPDMAGDANQDGTINATDLRLIVLMASGSIPVNLAADCNHDGKITTADATCAQAKLADMHLNPSKYVQTGTYFVYDGAGQLLGEYAQSGAAIQETVWLGNTPVAVLSGNNSFYVYADHLNAPRAISDSTGTVVWRWDSEAFGTSLANSDPDGNRVTFTYNLRFPGQYYDSETGLHYNNARDYNPATGRYIQSDPIGLAGGLNTYTYVKGNPVNWSDPLGTCGPLTPLCIAGVVAIEAAARCAGSEICMERLNAIYEEALTQLDGDGPTPSENNTSNMLTVLEVVYDKAHESAMNESDKGKTCTPPRQEFYVGNPQFDPFPDADNSEFLKNARQTIQPLVQDKLDCDLKRGVCSVVRGSGS